MKGLPPHAKGWDVLPDPSEVTQDLPVSESIQLLTEDLCTDCVHIVLSKKRFF